MVMIPFSPAGSGVPSGVDDLGLDARQRDARGARLDRQQRDAVRIAEHRTAGLGLPHVVDDRDAIAVDLVLEPLPGRAR